LPNKKYEKIITQLTFVVKNALLEEKADFVSTGDEVVGVSLRYKGRGTLTD